jgi:hypothetical protein
VDAIAADAAAENIVEGVGAGLMENEHNNMDADNENGDGVGDVNNDVPQIEQQKSGEDGDGVGVVNPVQNNGGDPLGDLLGGINAAENGAEPEDSEEPKQPNADVPADIVEGGAAPGVADVAQPNDPSKDPDVGAEVRSDNISATFISLKIVIIINSSFFRKTKSIFTSKVRPHVIMAELRSVLST